MTSKLVLTQLAPGWGALGDVRPRTAVPFLGAAVHRTEGTRMPVIRPTTVTTTTTTFVNDQEQQPNLSHPAFAATYHREEPG